MTTQTAAVLDAPPLGTTMRALVKESAAPGAAHVCPTHPTRGGKVPGAFAQYVVMPEMNAWVSEHLTPEIAALQEPLGNAVHAAFVEEVAGQTAVVTGCGPIGLMSIGVLK